MGVRLDLGESGLHVLFAVDRPLDFLGRVLLVVAHLQLVDGLVAGDRDQPRLVSLGEIDRECDSASRRV